ncbi:MAG: ATP synthase F0 subunit B [Moorea sp. SIO2B7]|nr:ATP synthase F0 subunit B [Moorena sp. SIO2B7]
MLRQNSSRNGSERDDPIQRDSSLQTGGVSFDIQRELNQLEELVLDSPRIPFTGRTIVDEEQLLEQLDLVRMNLPHAFEQALEVLRQKEEILLEAEDYAQNIITAAEQRAAQILDETGIIQQAEMEANQLQQQVLRECEEIEKKTIAEIDQMRRSAQQEMEQLRQLTLAECEDIQYGADEYADSVLNGIEQQLTDMLRVIRNGRKQLHPNSPSRISSDKEPPNASGKR